MPEMMRGIAGMVTAGCLVGIVLFAYGAPSREAALVGALIGFLFTISIFKALFRNSFMGGVGTVGTIIGFGTLVWYRPGFFYIFGSAILGGVCAVILVPVIFRK